MDSQASKSTLRPGRLARQPVWGVIALVCLAVAPAAPAQAAAEPNRHIDSYVLFAYDDIDFPVPSVSSSHQAMINGGNVGANGVAGGPFDPKIKMGTALIMSDDSQLVGDIARLSDSSSVFDLFTNSVLPASLNPATIVRNSGPQGFSTPIIDPASLPSAPVISPGATSVTVNNGTTMTLPPGQYGKILVEFGATLNLQGGSYQIAELTVRSKATVNVSPDTTVLSTGNIRFLENSKVLGSSQAQFATAAVDGVGSIPFRIGQHVEFHGQVLAPNGGLHLSVGNDLYGRFWAEHIYCDCDITVTYEPPPPPDCDTDPTQPQCQPPDCTVDPSQNGCTPPPPPPPPPSTPTPPSGTQSTAVSEQTVPAGRAALSRTRACISRRQRIKVRGRSIRKATFKLDGKRIRVDRRAPFTATIKRGRLSVGAHHLKVRVVFRRGSGTRARTLRRTLQRCGTQSLSPRFTG